MRRFILADKTAMADYPTTIPLTAGQVAFAAFKNDGAGTDGTGLILDADGTKIKKEGVILYHDGQKMWNIPIYKNSFSYVKSVYAAGTAFNCNITIPAPTAGLTYTMILVKKGMPFNHRNKWTGTYLAKDGDTANTVADYLRKYFSANAAELDVKVTGTTSHVIITGNDKRQDYEIVFADDLAGTVQTPTHAIAPTNDAKAIQEMWLQAAGDMGYTDTFDDFIYRGHYPLNPLRASDTADAGFIVYTLQFAEPRTTRTVDTAINQIVQIALPTGTLTAKIDAVLVALAK